jgi:hypothetical protein
MAMTFFFCPNCHSDKVLGDKTGAPSLAPKRALMVTAGCLTGLVLVAVGLVLGGASAVWFGGLGALLILMNVAVPVLVVFYRPVQTFRCLNCGFTVRGRSPARPVDPNKPGVVVPFDAPGAHPAR